MRIRPAQIAAGIAVAALLAMLVVLDEDGGPPVAAPSPSPSASPSAEETLPPPGRLGPDGPFAAVAFPRIRATAIATIDGDGSVRVCFEALQTLQLADVSADTVLFTDDRSVYRMPLSCDRPAEVLVDAERLAGGRDPDLTQLGCAAISPDGSRVALQVAHLDRAETDHEMWVGGLDGTGWRKVAEEIGCGWVDDEHLLGLPPFDGDPFAVAIDDGTLAMLERPRMWTAAGRSPDGRFALVQTPIEGTIDTPADRRRPVRAGDALSVVVDRAGDAETPVRLPPADRVLPCCWQSGWPDPSAWSPSGERLFVVRGGDRPPAGTVEVFRWDGGVMTGEGEAGRCLCNGRTRAGWLTDTAVWTARRDGIGVFDVVRGEESLIRLSGLTGATGTWSENLNGQMIVKTTRSAQAPSATPGAEIAAALRRTPVGDVSIALPPGWKATGCEPGCTVAGLQDAWRVDGQVPLALSSVRPPLAVGTFPGSRDEVARRLIEAAEARATPCPTKEGCSEVIADRPVRVAGRDARRIEVRLIDDGVTWIVVPGGARSVVVEMPATGLDRFYPSLRMALASLRIS